MHVVIRNVSNWKCTADRAKSAWIRQRKGRSPQSFCPKNFCPPYPCRGVCLEVHLHSRTLVVLCRLFCLGWLWYRGSSAGYRNYNIYAHDNSDTHCSCCTQTLSCLKGSHLQDLYFLTDAQI